MDSYGAATAFASESNLNSLASSAFASIGVIDNTTTFADDYLIEITIANIAEAGNRQAVVWARTSVDGTNYSDNTTGATNRKMLGSLDLNGLSAAGRSIAMPLAVAFGGIVPPKVEILVQNDAGVAFAASGNTAQYRAVNF
jgi:hypothetical protein